MASSGKFDGVDFSQINVELLTPELRQLGQGFRCVRGEFVTYWKQGRIQRETEAHLCQCPRVPHQLDFRQLVRRQWRATGSGVGLAGRPAHWSRG